jgi:hypothetical protein
MRVVDLEAMAATMNAHCSERQGAPDKALRAGHA